MQFPQAHSGLLKVFIGEIIGLAASVVLLVATIFGAIPVNESFAMARVMILMLLGLFGGTALIASFVLQLIGLIQSGKEEPALRAALWATVVAAIVAVVGTALNSTKPEWAMVAAILSGVVSILSAVAKVYILTGIVNLAAHLREPSMVASGKRLITLVTVVFLLGIILVTLSRVLTFEAGTPGESVLLALGIAGGALETIVYVLTLRYYGKAVRMLEK